MDLYFKKYTKYKKKYLEIKGGSENKCILILYIRNTEKIPAPEIETILKNIFEEKNVSYFTDQEKTMIISIMFKDFIVKENVLAFQIENEPWCTEQVNDNEILKEINSLVGDPNSILTAYENNLIQKFKENSDINLSYLQTVRERPGIGCGTFIPESLFGNYYLVLTFDVQNKTE